VLIGFATGGVAYVMGDKGNKGEERTPRPALLSGDPKLTQRLINSLDFAHKQTTGVLSFEETISPDLEKKIMGRFEEAAFAGLDKDQYNILWVRHAHTGRTELHFVVPRMELSTGKSLNIAPPTSSSRTLFETFKHVINAEYGLSSPQDPARARSLSIPGHWRKIEAQNKRLGLEAPPQPRELLHQLLEAQVVNGLIESRDDVIDLLKEQGFEIHRKGKDYLSIRGEVTGAKSWRMKGVIYSELFQKDGGIREELKSAESRSRETVGRLHGALTEKLERLATKRSEYNQTRYGQSAEPVQREHRRTGKDLREGMPQDGKFLRTDHQEPAENNEERTMGERIRPSSKVVDPHLALAFDRAGNPRIERVGDEVVLAARAGQDPDADLSIGESPGRHEALGSDDGGDRGREIPGDSPGLRPLEQLELRKADVREDTRLGGSEDERNREHDDAAPGGFRGALEAARDGFYSAIGRIRKTGTRIRDGLKQGLGGLGSLLRAEAEKLSEEFHEGTKIFFGQATSGMARGLRDHARSQDTRARGANEQLENAVGELASTAGELERTAGKAVYANKDVGMTLDKRASELEAFKTDVNLAAYATSMGYGMDHTRSSRNSLSMGNSEGDKVVITRAQDGHWIYFSLTTPKDHGTIIDFHQKRTNDNLGEVRKALRPWLSGKEKEQASYSWVKGFESKEGADIIIALGEMKNLTKSRYLNSRGISDETLQWEKFAGQVRQDQRGNVNFPHHDTEGHCGWEERNCERKAFGAGTRKGLWRSNMHKGDDRLVIFESAIDALSYHQLHGRETNRYLSTAGSLSDKQLEYLADHFDRLPDAQVVIATDRSKSGDLLGEKIRQVAPERKMYRHTPENTKDWNEELQHQQRENARQAAKGRDYGMEM
jgi:hypothetical protein